MIRKWESCNEVDRNKMKLFKVYCFVFLNEEKNPLKGVSGKNNNGWGA
jgi:hypothetical protein